MAAENHEVYIIQDGVRIGFFKNSEDAQFAMRLCPKGIIKSKKDWEKEENKNGQ